MLEGCAARSQWVMQNLICKPTFSKVQRKQGISEANSANSGSNSERIWWPKRLQCLSVGCAGPQLSSHNLAITHSSLDTASEVLHADRCHLGRIIFEKTFFKIKFHHAMHYKAKKAILGFQKVWIEEQVAWKTQRETFACCRGSDNAMPTEMRETKTQQDTESPPMSAGYVGKANWAKSQSYHYH